MHSVKTHRQLNLPTDISLQSRINRITKTKKRFHCPRAGCKKNYESRQKIVQHFQKVHAEKTHKCAACGSEFALNRDLKYHAKKFCYKLREGRTTESRRVKPRPKKATLGTQTDARVVGVVLNQILKTANSQTQTDDQMNGYQISSNYSTTDFAAQYDQPVFGGFNQRWAYLKLMPYRPFSISIPTYDQATTYDGFPSTSSYIGQAPEMVDVSTYVANDSHNYFTGPSNFLTQTTQTYFNSECSHWRGQMEIDYRTQTNSSTQTHQPSLESWYGKNREISRDMSSMTDQMYLR